VRADVVIRGGTIVNGDGVAPGDVAVRDGEIVAVEEQLVVEAAEEIDAAGMLVLPGGVDPHVHLAAGTQGQRTADDFFTGTRAAALGGTTTVIDFCYQPEDGPLVDGLRRRLELAEREAVVDYGFHLVVTRLDARNVPELDEVCAAGISSFKVYTAYARRNLFADDGTLFRLFDRCATLGAIPVVHAENGMVNDVLVDMAHAGGRFDVGQHPLTHPEASEVEATRRVLAIAGLAGAAVYFVHVSCAAALEAITDARRAGQVVFAETCPHYLLLDDSLYQLPSPEAVRFVMNPPLRAARSHPVLWAALAAGAVDVIATDHSSFNLEQKALGRDDFAKTPNGIPGIEHRLTLLFDEGVRRGRLSPERWVAAVSSRPAALFGLERKGRIAAGYDADIVVFDPHHEDVITYERHHMNVDYNAYEGRRTTGAPRTVLSRGEIIVRGGTFVGERGRGRFLERSVTKWA
jgi:dihydropyrimidinase